MILSINVDGRGFVSPVINVHWSEEYVNINVHCERNPEFWLNLTLSATNLLDLLRGIVDMQKGEQDAGLDFINELAVNLGIATE